jgi:hypothetical protein
MEFQFARKQIGCTDSGALLPILQSSGNDLLKGCCFDLLVDALLAKEVVEITPEV